MNSLDDLVVYNTITIGGQMQPFTRKLVSRYRTLHRRKLGRGKHEPSVNKLANFASFGVSLDPIRGCPLLPTDRRHESSP